MVSIDISFQLKFVVPTSVQLTKIKFNSSHSPEFNFRLEDQALSSHSFFFNLMKSKKITNGSWYTTCLRGNDLNTYFDVKTNKFWFNKVYLKSDFSDNEFDLYDKKIKPEEFVSRFEKHFSKKTEISKINKFVDLIPLEHRNDVRIASLNGYRDMINCFYKLCTPEYLEFNKKILYKKSYDSMFEMCQEKSSFYSSFGNLKFDQYFKYISLEFDNNQLKYLENYKIKTLDELLDLSRNYDACRLIEKQRL